MARVIQIQVNPKIDDATLFLSSKYAQIRKWAEKHDVVEIISHELINPLGASPLKVTLYGVEKDDPNVTNIKNSTFTIAREHFEFVQKITNTPNVQGLLNRLDDPRSKKVIPMAYAKHELSFEEYDATTIPRTKRQTWKAAPMYGYSCNCDLSFLCPKVTNIIKSGDRWWLSPKKKKNDDGFYLFIPVFGHVLYSFFVEPRKITDWAGVERPKLIVYGPSDDETIFYDAPPVTDTSKCSLLSDQIDSISQLANILADKWRHPLVEFAAHRSNISCFSKDHKYGTNVKFQRFLTEEINSYAVSALTLELYQMCYICYRANVPAFYLIRNDLF